MECQIECDDGFLDCNDDRRDGCEQSSEDVLTCGACDKECPFLPGEEPFCLDGVCGSTPCPDGFGNCDGKGETCEKDLTSDVMNCGVCRHLCSVNNGTPKCEAKECGVQSCDEPFANCNTTDPGGGYMDGCETNTDTDVNNCGACGRACSVSHGTAACVAGQCRVMMCDAGYENCDRTSADQGYSTGCEKNTNTDKANCGACGISCDSQFPNATGVCTAGRCALDQCNANFGDCDRDGRSCESNLLTDEGACGACNRVCSPTGTTGSPGNTCTNGTCVPTCDATHANCNTMGPDGCEINTSTDNTNCGGCGTTCAAGRTCSSGNCVCTGGLTLCSGSCVNTTNDDAHCGNCTTVCTGGRSCVSSVCQCPAGQTFCNGSCVNMQTDTMNCGMCGRICQTPAGTLTNPCMAGACVPGCDVLRASCDMEPWDGCEENLASNNANCGACGRACQTGTGAPAFVSANTCSAAGACQPTCVTGHSDCNSQPWDGCEADITTVTRCGGCNTDCAGTACGSAGDTSCCVASGTNYACQAQITIANDVDASVAGPTLTFTHALQAGTNRMIFLAVAAEKGDNDVAKSRPDSVTYGGTTMLPLPPSMALEQSGGPTFWSPDIYFYYLTESGIGAKTNNQTVVVDGNVPTGYPGGPDVIIANLVQLQGVRQSNPIGQRNGGILPGTNPNPDVISQSLTVTTSGSRIYTMTAAMFCSGSSLTPSVTPAGPMVTTTLNIPSVAGSVADMRAAAAYIGSGGANTLAGGPAVSYSPTWTYSNCAGITHSAVVILPAP
jgi:hypothetical protein